MRNKIGAAVMAIALMAGGCSRTEAQQGPEETRNFALKGFDRVALAGADSIKVIYGRDFAVAATGTPEALDRLDIRQDGGTLVVARKKESGWHMGWGKKNRSAVVTVTMPLVRAVSLSGAGDLNVATATAEDAFDADLTGTGTLKVENSRAKAVALSLTGAGDMKLRGAADTVKAKLTGTGNMDATALTAREVDVSLTGAGNIAASASELATGALSGVGNVDVTGTARCAIRKSGVGDVRCGGPRE